MPAKFLINPVTNKYVLARGTGGWKIGNAGDPCCGCTPKGRSCGSCDPIAPAMQISVSGMETAAPARYIVFGTRAFWWVGAAPNGDYCARQVTTGIGLLFCVFGSYGEPVIAYECTSTEVGDGSCVSAPPLSPVSTFCTGWQLRRAGDRWALTGPYFSGVSEVNADCSATVTITNNIVAPRTDGFGTQFGCWGGTAVVSPLTTFCESGATEECNNENGAVPQPEECAVGCDGCSEIYRGKFVLDGNDVLFCLEVQIVAGVEGGPPTTCIWQQTTDDFRAVLYCTVIDGVPTRVLDVSHETYGVNSFTQVVGAEDCPQASWTLATLDSGLTTASVADFEAAASCCDGPCEVTASNSGADNTGNRDQSWSVGAAAAYITTPFGSWVAPPTGAYWISHASDNVSSGTTHDYTTTITLCGTEEGLDQLYIPIEVAADNEITDILINGNSTGIAVTDTNSFTQIYARYLPPGFWVDGDNTIVVQTFDSGVVGGLLFKFGTPDCSGEFLKCKFCKAGYVLSITSSGDGYDGTYNLFAVSDPVDGVLPTCQWEGGDVFDGGSVSWVITYHDGGFHLVGTINYDFDATDYIVEFFFDDIDNPGGCPLYSEWTMITNEIPGSAGTASATTAEIP